MARAGLDKAIVVEKAAQLAKAVNPQSQTLQSNGLIALMGMKWFGTA